MSTKFIPRMRDVADRCGVAEFTVLHVLNGITERFPRGVMTGKEGTVCLNL